MAEGYVDKTCSSYFNLAQEIVKKPFNWHIFYKDHNLSNKSFLNMLFDSPFVQGHSEVHLTQSGQLFHGDYF